MYTMRRIYYGTQQSQYTTTEVTKKISFGGIPNRRKVLFLQIFLKRAAKPSAGNISLLQSLPALLRNLLLNPVEPDLALHQSVPGTFSGTFSGTLCT